MCDLLAYLLASMGLTVLVVWPQKGPGAWLRDKLLRSVLPASSTEVLDCYICCSFWCSLLLSPLWWAICGRAWYGTGCLMTPGLFWLLLRPDR